MGYYDNTEIGERNKKINYDLKNVKTTIEEKTINENAHKDSYKPSNIGVLLTLIILAILTTACILIGIFAPITFLLDGDLRFSAALEKLVPFLIKLVILISVLLFSIIGVISFDKNVGRK